MIKKKISIGFHPVFLWKWGNWETVGWFSVLNLKRQGISARSAWARPCGAAGAARGWWEGTPSSCRRRERSRRDTWGPTGALGTRWTGGPCAGGRVGCSDSAGKQPISTPKTTNKRANNHMSQDGGARKSQTDLFSEEEGDPLEHLISV